MYRGLVPEVSFKYLFHGCACLAIGTKVDVRSVSFMATVRFNERRLVIDIVSIISEDASANCDKGETQMQRQDGYEGAYIIAK